MRFFGSMMPKHRVGFNNLNIKFCKTVNFLLSTNSDGSYDKLGKIPLGGAL